MLTHTKERIWTAALVIAATAILFLGARCAGPIGEAGMVQVSVNITLADSTVTVSVED